MPSIYFPDVPEYRPLVRAVAKQPQVRRTKAGGYVAIRSSRPIRIRREQTGLAEAVWFGALVGGYAGRVVKFDDEELEIA